MLNGHVLYFLLLHLLIISLSLVKLLLVEVFFRWLSNVFKRLLARVLAHPANMIIFVLLTEVLDHLLLFLQVLFHALFERFSVRLLGHPTLLAYMLMTCVVHGLLVLLLVFPHLAYL